MGDTMAKKDLFELSKEVRRIQREVWEASTPLQDQPQYQEVSEIDYMCQKLAKKLENLKKWLKK